jgi:hypothetical protein
MNLTPGSICS